MKPRHAKARFAKDFPHPAFAAASFDRRRMVVLNAKSSRDEGRGHSGTIAESENSVDRLTPDSFQYNTSRSVRRFEMDGDGAIAPGIIEPVAAIRDKHKLDAKFMRSFVEAARLVAKFRGEEE